MKQREMLPIDPNEFMSIHDGIVISQEFQNEVKKDGNIHAEIFGNGVDLLAMVEQGLVSPVGRCPETKSIIYTATEAGEKIARAYQERNYSVGLRKRLSNGIKKYIGF